MSFSSAVSARNAMLDALGALLNGGTLRLKTAGGGVLANLPMANPAFNPAVNGEATARGMTPGVAILAGVAATVELLDSGGVVRVSGDVGTTSAAMLAIDNANIALTQVISVSNFKFTVPA